MSTKVIRVPANIPTAFLKEAILKHLKENDETEVIDKTLGGTHHYEGDERDEKGRVKRDSISYEEIATKSGKSKGLLKGIIATLSGSSSSSMRVVVDDLLELQDLVERLEAVKERFKNNQGREKLHNLFGPLYEFVTRTVILANTFKIVMSKQPKAAETVKWASVWEDLSKHLTPELIAKGEEIIKQYSTIQAPKPPTFKIKRVGEEDGNDLEESVIPNAWDKIKKWFSHFADSVKSWGKAFDSKLEHIQERANKL